MAESAQIDKISSWHDALITFLVANPRMKRAEIARHFDVTPSWLSTVLHSDVFKAKLAERQEDFFSAATAPIRERLESLATLSIDRLEEKVQVEADIDSVREVAKLALTNLGYGNGANGKQHNPQLVQQNNFYSVSPELLAAARERILTQHGTTLDAPQEPYSSPEEFQAGHRDSVGPALLNAPAVREAEKAPRPEENGGEV